MLSEPTVARLSFDSLTSEQTARLLPEFNRIFQLQLRTGARQTRDKLASKEAPRLQVAALLAVYRRFSEVARGSGLRFRAPACYARRNAS